MAQGVLPRTPSGIEVAEGVNFRYVDVQYQRIVDELATPLTEQFPWPIKFLIKVDKFGSDRIFHARYLETQHAVIRIDHGFDLFKQNNGFRRNFFTLRMVERSHLKECRELPERRAYICTLKAPCRGS